MAADCLKNLIGLSRESCPCFPDLPETAIESVSGIYIDEMDGFGDILRCLCGLKNCPEKTIWEIMDRARCNAIDEFYTDLCACLYDNNEADEKIEIRNQYVGTEIKYDYGKIKKRYTVMPLNVKCGRDIKSCINKIGLLPFKVNGKVVPVTRHVEIYSSMGQILTPETVQITTTDDGISWFTFSEPFVINPDDYGSGCIYFVYENNDCSGNVRHNVNRTWCGCDKTATPKWVRMLQPHAFQADDIGEDSGCEADFFGNKFKKIKCCNSSKQGMQGFALDIEFGCDLENLICSKTSGKSPYIGKIARLVSYKAACKIIDAILANKSINYTAITAKENFFGLKNMYKAGYLNEMYGDKDGRVKGLCQTLNVNDSACFCKKKSAAPKFGRGW